MDYAQNMAFYSNFFIEVVVSKSNAYSFLRIGMMFFFQKQYYFRLECCDSIFSLLSRALQDINKTEVLSLNVPTENVYFARSVLPL